MQKNKATFSILDKGDHRFQGLHLTLDTVSSELHRQGIGALRKSAADTLPDHEELFWERGLLGTSSPTVIQHTLFFYTGLQFVVRGVQEQQDLVPSQFVHFPADHSVYSEHVYYQYTEYILKNNQHRLRMLASEAKRYKAMPNLVQRDA